MTMPEQIGAYRITGELGRGGMGVVYRATDTALDRDVAIKALPEDLATDKTRLERFEREAKTLAQLNHPNIAGIHGLEEKDGARYLVLEYVEGGTLADRLDRGAIPFREAIDFASQIASGVEAAHEAGVVHRDLKPANILITPEGQPKVLDFGLARTDEGQSSSDVSQAATLTTPVHAPTSPGMVIGTAAYMSPEQARGRRVDKRTDIWSFGVILYEMLCGASPFIGETATDSIGAVLHKDLDLDRLPPAVPSSVRRVLERCLDRDKQLRYRDIGDVAVELRRAADEPDATPAATTKAQSSPLWPVAAAVLLLALLATAFIAFRPAPAPRPIQFTLESPQDTRILFDGDLAGPPVVSPDGTMVAFVAIREGELRKLWLRDLSKAESRVLDGTDDALFPFWSPDSAEIGYFTPNSLRRYDVNADTVQKICDANQGRGAAWINEDTIVFSPSFRSGLVTVSPFGGPTEPVTTRDAELHTSHRWPFAIAGTNRFLYSAVSARAGETDNNATYMASLDPGFEPVRVMPSSYRAEYHDGWLLHVRDGSLLATRFDPESGTLTGRPSPIARGVDTDLSTWHGQFSASASGLLVYARSQNDSANEASGYSWEIEGDQIDSFTYDGRITTSYAKGMPMRSIALSPDGRTIAMDVVGEDGFLDIWLHPSAFIADPDSADELDEVVRASITNPEPRRLTFLPDAEVEPVWSPDSEEVAFRWAGDGSSPPGIYRKRIGGGGHELVYETTEEFQLYPTDWTPDGKYIIAVSGTLVVTPANDIWAVPVDGGDPVPLVQTPDPDVSGRVSPDGRWLVYSTGGSSISEIFVIPFAPAWPGDTRSRRWLVSENGGTLPRWSREGDRLFYISSAQVLIAVDVDTTGDVFQYSTPQALFQTPIDIGQVYDPSPRRVGGETQFMFLTTGVRSDRPISTILHWPSLLDTE